MSDHTLIMEYQLVIKHLRLEVDELKLQLAQANAELQECRKDREMLIGAIRKISNIQPCMNDGGCFYPQTDGEGNPIGDQNVDPLGVIQSMCEVANNAIHEIEAMNTK